MTFILSPGVYPTVTDTDLYAKETFIINEKEFPFSVSVDFNVVVLATHTSISYVGDYPSYTERLNEMKQWCSSNFGCLGTAWQYHTPNAWNTLETTFYFRSEADYALFTLTFL